MSRDILRWLAVSTVISIAACSYTPPDGGSSTDGPPLPTVQFKTASSLADENVASLKIPVELSEPSTSSVDFRVTGGIAILNTDFAFINGSTSGTLSFSGTTADIEIMISNDGLEEPDETIELTLENPQGAALGDQVTHVVTISADILPRVKFTSTATSRAEDTAGAKLDLELDIAPTTAVSIDLALAGAATAVADYGLTAQTVTFAAGQTTAELDYEVVADDRDELDEIIAVDLTNPGGVVIDTTAAHTEHTIIDDDATPTVSFVNASATQAESVADATQTVQLSAASNLVITVPFTQAGTANANDVTVGGTGTLTFQPGETMQTIPITVIDDNRDETATETVILTLGTPTNATLGATPEHTLNIQDNDNPPVLSFAAATSNAAEGGAQHEVVVNLVGLTDLTVTVDFARLGASTAVATTDFTFANPTTTLTFAPGDTTAKILIDVTDDAVGELDETLVIGLSNLTNATAGATTQHTVTIGDDDCLGTGSFRVCVSAAPAGTKTLSGAFNTDSDTNCETAQPFAWTTTFGQPASCFVIADTITVAAGGLQVTGSRPLALVAGTSISVVGVLDASANSTTNGPAGPSSLCSAPATAAASSSNGGGGGAGGSFLTKGGNGGDGNNGAVGGSNSPAADAADPTILRGGCRGADGGTGPGTAGVGGGAGGAVYLVAPTITIGGTIDVSGSGGLGGAADAGGGGGGGAGGSIFLDPLTTLDFTGTLMSNGGGGGQGADNNTTGQNGGDPTSPTVNAPGGNTGGAGGAGGRGHRTGAGSLAGSNGGNGQGAGGGGGGGGFIKSTKALGNMGTASAGKIVP